MKKILFALMAMILMVGSVMAVSFSDLSIHKVADTVTNYNVDIAVDSADHVHRVYERNNKIYYSVSDGNEELVSKGVNPAIAVGPNNQPQITFENNDQLYYAHKVNGNWEFSVFNGANADIAVDSNNNPYIVYMNKDQYPDVILSTLVGQGFSDTVIFDGSYNNFGGGSHVTNTYDTPLIKVDSNNKYHIVAYHFNRDCAGSCDNSYSTVYASNANGGQSASGPSRSYTKNALTVDSSNVAHMVYGDGSVYYATPMNSWNEALVTDEGSKSAVDTRDSIVGVTYTFDGDVYYTEDKGTGFSIPKIVDSGNNPVIGVGSAFIDYLQDGKVYEAYMNTNTGGHNEDPIQPPVNSSVITPSAVAGTVYYNGTAVEGATVEVTCNNVSASATTNLFGDYDVEFTSDNCKFGDSVTVVAHKDSLNGQNTGSMCDSQTCEIPIGLVDVDVQVPEFGVIGGALVLLAGIGIVFYRRK